MEGFSEEPPLAFEGDPDDKNEIDETEAQREWKRMQKEAKKNFR